MDIVNQVLTEAAEREVQFKPTHVDKHLELSYDVGTLLACDGNEIDVKRLRAAKDKYLKELARDNTQLLLNKVWELPTKRIDEAIVATLPNPVFGLPREKPLPKPKELTKWQKFAQEKGIQKTKKSKLKWDDILQKWVPNYGFKRSAAEKEKNWMLEVPATADPYEDQFEKMANAKKEKVAKNEFQRLRNLAAAKNIKVPRSGLPTVEFLDSTQLKTAATISKISTASLGKFQEKLPTEKQTSKVVSSLPITAKKRKIMLTPEQEKKSGLNILSRILNKKPKIDMEKAVNRHINEEQQQRAIEKQQKPQTGGQKKAKGRGKRPHAKPAGGKGKRGPRKTTGRKRR